MYYTSIFVDLDTSTAARSSDPPEDDEQLSLDPLDDDPLFDDLQAEDDKDAEEEPVEEPTVAEIVEAGVSQGQLDSDTIPVDQHAVDEAEERLIKHFAHDGCKCNLGPNRNPCRTTITAEHFHSVRCRMLELTRDELALVFIGQVMAASLKRPLHTEGRRAESPTPFSTTTA